MGSETKVKGRSEIMNSLMPIHNRCGRNIFECDCELD